MPSRCDRCSRREFLLFSAGTLAAVACGGGTSSSNTGGDVSVGNVSSLPAGGTLIAADDSSVALRDSGGVYALSLTCTHAGCNLAQSGTVTGQQLTCACHGSEFGPDGEVLRGPASQPLPHFAVSVDASGNIVIHTAQTVDASTRVAV